MSEGPQRPGVGSGEEDETEVRVTQAPESAATSGAGDDAAIEGADSPSLAAAAAPTMPDALPDASALPGAPSVVVRTSGGRALAVSALIISLLLLVALAVPAWFVYRGEDLFAWVPSPRLDAFEARAAQIEADLRADRRSSTDSLDREAELRAGLEDLGRAFTSLSADIAADDPIDDRQWRIAETAYLLRVANLRAGMEDDREGAEALLRAADELLREIGDFGLVPVREAIAVALADLRGAPAVDRVGIYLELEALGEQIDDLRLDGPSYPSGSGMAAPVSTSDGWLSALGVRFEGLIDFRVHRPPPVSPLLAPQENAFLRHNLALKLEQAQLALLQRDAVVWRRSLAEASALVDGYFDASDAAASELADALARLATEQVDVRAPDISTPHSELLRLRGRANFLAPGVRPMRGEADRS